MTQKLSVRAAVLLTVPPLLWSANVVLGRVVAGDISPMTLNAVRWLVGFVVLLPFGGWVLRSAEMRSHWRSFAVLGLLGIACYNSLQYLALHTSTPLNVSLVVSALPVFMLLVGRLFFGARVHPRQVAGAVLSLAGVLVVLSHGSLATLLSVRLVPGDLFALAASLSWAFYSWFLQRRAEPASIRNDWVAYLLAQLAFGLVWSGLFTAGEWASGWGELDWSPRLGLAVLFIALGPGVAAFASFGKGVALAGPAVAGFFTNLVPIFVAVLSVIVLGQTPHLYHAVSFALIVAGIVVSSRRPQGTLR